MYFFSLYKFGFVKYIIEHYFFTLLVTRLNRLVEGDLLRVAGDVIPTLLPLSKLLALVRFTGDWYFVATTALLDALWELLSLRLFLELGDKISSRFLHIGNALSDLKGVSE